eukprot:m.1268483 g.1268483  ORF g.1268483 m.1268483 type:complete len:119 (+) comp24745_c0_seq12:314-670(+)
MRMTLGNRLTRTPPTQVRSPAGQKWAGDEEEWEEEQHYQNQLQRLTAAEYSNGLRKCRSVSQTVAYIARNEKLRMQPHTPPATAVDDTYADPYGDDDVDADTVAHISLPDTIDEADEA